MRLAKQTEYRRHTLLHFEPRVNGKDRPAAGHWLVIAPDEVNVVGTPKPTEAEARAFVDALLRSEPAPRAD